MRPHEFYAGLSKDPIRYRFKLFVRVVTWCVLKGHTLRYVIPSQASFQKSDVTATLSLSESGFGI